MLVIRQAEQAALKLIQVKYGDGWYENGALITSYAAHGNSNVWSWTIPTKAVLAISGCGGGGGGGGSSNAYPLAGAGAGGGGSGLAVQNLIVLVPAGEIIKITVGANGVGGPNNDNAATDGGDTIIEFTSLYPGESDTTEGGSLGNGARLRLMGGQKGNSAWQDTGIGVGGHGGYGYLGLNSPDPPIAAGGLTSGADGTVTVLSIPPYTRQANGGGAGGLPGVSGGGNKSNIGYGARSSVGGVGSPGTTGGGGGGGGVSIFGPGGNGSIGWGGAPAMTWGYGSGGGGAGGNSPEGWDVGNGANGRPGYVEILYMAAL